MAAPAVTEDIVMLVEDKVLSMAELLLLGEEATPGEGRPAPLPGLRGPPQESTTSRASSPSVFVLEEASVATW